MKKNEEIKIEITALNSDGYGVGRHLGEVVFVPNTLPGENVEAHIIKCAKNYSVGKLMRVLAPSKDRIEPKCKYFYSCGGCDFQFMNYDAQLKEKCESALKNINKLSGKNLTIDKIIAADEQFFYRNKAQFPIKTVNGEVKIGFFAPRSHRIVDINECILQQKNCNKIISVLREAITKFNVSVYDEEAHTGILRHAIARNAKDGIMLILVTNSAKKFPQAFVNYIIEQLPVVKSIIQNVNTQKSNIILGADCITLWGNDYIRDEMCGIAFNLRPKAFLQINTKQTENLYSRVLELAQIDKDDIVFDAYCGIGVMSLMLAKKCKKLIGVEIVPEAIASAIEAAKINDVNNAEFLVGACEDVLPDLILKDQKPDVLVVDPPRAGCEESLLEAISKAEIKKIVYVSCNPSTLARDIKILSEFGYAASNLTFVDMFPQTKHIESVALLKRD